MPLSALHLGRCTLRAIALGLCAAMVTGCQSLSPASFARIRVIDLSADTPAVDIYQGSTAVAYNLSFGAVTSYVAAAPGTYTFTVDASGSRQVLASIEGTLSASTQYTVLVRNPAANLQPLLLTDGVPAGKGQTSAPVIRFLHQAARMAAVDVYLVPAGQRLASVTPIVTNFLPGGNSGYLPIPACVCTAVVLPAGTLLATSNTAAHTSSQASFLPGSARTLILLDDMASSPSGLQVISTVDAEFLN